MLVHQTHSATLDAATLTMLQGLLGRHSQGIKRLAEPGPDEAQLLTMTPSAHEAGKDAAAVALDAERTRRAPVTVAVVARIDMGHPLVPAHEQWAAVGGVS